jgi:mannose-6-phosphate isomerase-like protein (cupin superfamily)
MNKKTAVVHVRPDERQEYPTAERVRILESWNTRQDPAVSVARARLAAGESSEVHWLEGVDERFVILSGRATLEAGDIADLAVAPGDVVFVPAGARQRFHNTGSEDLVFLCICTPRFTPGCYHAGEPPADP